MKTGTMTARETRRIKARGAWLASTALAGICAGFVSGAAIAAEPAGASPANIAQAEQRLRFDIPAQDMNAAVLAYAQRAGVQLFYDAARLRGLQSRAVAGEHTSVEALGLLLGDSGVTYRFTGPTSVTLERAAADGGVTLPTVTAEGLAANSNSMIGNVLPDYAGGQVATGGALGVLGNRSVMDTPFNQTSYTAKLIEDQQARSIADVIVNDPSVRPTHPSTGHAEQFSVRGFNVGNHDIAFGGLYGVTPAYSVALEMAERVEVLKGPNALLSGMAPTGSVGGIINIVPKRAGAEPLTRITGSYLSEANLGGKADIARRFGANEEFGVRVNGFYRDGDTSINDQSKREGGLIAGLDYRGDGLRLSADMAHLSRRIESPSLPTYFAANAVIPDAPDNTSNWFQPWSWTDVEDNLAVMRGEIDVLSDWTAFVSAGGRESYYRTLIAYPLGTTSSGDFTATPTQYDYKNTNDTEEMGVRGRTDTGPIKHQITLSGTRYHETVDSAFGNPGALFASNIYNQVVSPTPNTSDMNRKKTSDNELKSFAIGDVLSMYDERLQLIVGLRQQQVLTRNYNTTTGAMTSRYDDDALTPSFGFVVKPWENVSLYGNYIEGLQRGNIVGSTYANAGQILPPYVSEQREVGVKNDWGSMTTTLSLFEIMQPSGSASCATCTYSADGEKRNRGIEFNVFGEAAEDVRVLGGVMLIDAELTKTANGVNQGNTAPGVADMRAVLGGEWDTPFMRGLTLSGRVLYTSSQYINNANTQSIPSWTRLDLGVRYKFENAEVPLTLRFNVDNVFDKSFWETSDGFSASAAAPRTFFLSMTADF
ncbi:MAG: TonB-dependent siderophore receptor [Alphaproteobacteria bacterium]